MVHTVAKTPKGKASGADRACLREGPQLHVVTSEAVPVLGSVIFKESYIYNFYITFLFGFSELLKIEKLYRHFRKVIYITFGYLKKLYKKLYI